MALPTAQSRRHLHVRTRLDTAWERTPRARAHRSGKYRTTPRPSSLLARPPPFLLSPASFLPFPLLLSSPFLLLFPFPPWEVQVFFPFLPPPPHPPPPPGGVAQAALHCAPSCYGPLPGLPRRTGWRRQKCFYFSYPFRRPLYRRRGKGYGENHSTRAKGVLLHAGGCYAHRASECGLESSAF